MTDGLALKIVTRTNQLYRERQETGGGPAYLGPRELAEEFGCTEGDVVRAVAEAVDAGAMKVGGLEVYGT